MKKNHIKNEIISYLENQLPSFKQRGIDAHLLVCEECKQLVKSFSTIYSSNDKKTTPDINPYFYTRVLAKLENESKSTSVIPVSLIKSLRPVAAGLFVLTAITFGIFVGNYITSGKQMNNNSQLTSKDISYEYYLSSSDDPMVNTIINNEK